MSFFTGENVISQKKLMTTAINQILKLEGLIICSLFYFSYVHVYILALLQCAMHIYSFIYIVQFNTIYSFITMYMYAMSKAYCIAVGL